MKKYTKAQYIKMAESFNKKTFAEKIQILRDNNDILTLASDGNWWGIEVKDHDMNEQLEADELCFTIKKEWGSEETDTLVYLLGIGNTDHR